MKRKHPKWLLRKISGSRSKYVDKPDYSDTRQIKNSSLENLPFRKSMGKSSSHLDTTLVKRWLHSQVGKDFDEVYALFIKRIQPKYLDRYKECIFWYVSRPHELDFDEAGMVIKPWERTFFIDPEHNILKKHSADDLKKAKPIKLYSNFYSLRYSMDSKHWKCLSSYLNFELSIKDKYKHLNKTHLSKIDAVVKKIKSLFQEAKEEIASLAMKSKNTEILLSKKHLIAVHFDLELGLNQFYILIEIAKDTKIWKIEFDDFQMINIVRIKR